MISMQIVLKVHAESTNENNKIESTNENNKI